jgi:cytochrome c oxidase cbb3-type subunit 3
MKTSAVLLLVLLVALAGCEREQHEARPQPLPTGGPQAVAQGHLRPGNAPPPATAVPAAAEQDLNNAYQISEGKRLFQWFNCSGCHSQGGGGMGPALMDDKWIYGGEPEQIFATIRDGRPNGMPSWQGKIPDQQIWQLVAYVRSMGRYVSKPAAPGRNDSMFPHPSEQRALPAPPPESGSVPPAGERPG